MRAITKWLITGLGGAIALYGSYVLVVTLWQMATEGIFTKMGMALTLGVILLALGVGLIRAARREL